MRMYVSDEAGKKLSSAAEKKGKSPEDTLQEAVDCLDDGDDQVGTQPEDDAGAADVPKTG
jgi:hypothetical protein